MSDETFVTRVMEDQAEAEAFYRQIDILILDLREAKHALGQMVHRHQFTIPPGTDCAAFEARIKAITDDIESMMDGYAPGEKRA